MGATISFHAGSDFTVQEMSGSGIGWFGDGGFGSSVRVGEYASRAYITNSAGTSQGPEIDNLKYHSDTEAVIGSSGSGVALTVIPNYQATLNIRSTFDTPVRVENVKVFFTDRVSTSNMPSGVTVKAAELIHPDESQASTPVGSGDSEWLTVGGSGAYLELANSPGPSGLYAGNGENSQFSSSRHDHYLAISVSPDSIGSKSQFGLTCELEYL